MRILYFLITIFLFASCSNSGEQSGASSTVDSTTVETPEQPLPEKEEPKDYQFPEIEGKEWRLTSYEYDGNSVKGSFAEVPFIMIEEGKISGIAGCNSLNGSVNLESDGSISVGELATTKKICQNKMTQEQNFLTLLQGAQTYSVNKIFLEITSESGKLSFRTNLDN